MDTTFDQKQVLQAAYRLVEEHLGNDTTGHDSAHIFRVVKLALHIAATEEGDLDLFLIEISALLHDIEDPKLGNDNKNIVKIFLSDNHVPGGYQLKIFDIIDNMSYSATMRGKMVASLEGKIVQDADRLDALGAIGIARTFTYGGAKKRPMDTSAKDATIHHFTDKLLKLAYLMNTSEGKRIANKRTRFINLYLKHYFDEKQISD